MTNIIIARAKISTNITEYSEAKSKYKESIANEGHTEASVLLATTIKTIVGNVRYDELFQLVRDGDTRLIEALEITSETILLDTFDL